MEIRPRQDGIAVSSESTSESVGSHATNSHSASSAIRFSELFDPLLAIFLRNAFFLTGDVNDAEDLVQEAALLAFRSFSHYEEGTNFRAWFFRIQYNCLLVQARTRSRRPRTISISEHDSFEELYLFERTRNFDSGETGLNPATVFFNAVDAREIAEATAALPAEFRAVATLFFFNELSYEEIAEIVSCPLNTVRSRLRRARRMLQRALWGLARERGIVTGDPPRSAEQKGDTTAEA